MGMIRPQEPVLLMLAMFSRYEEALRWSLARATETWGNVALTSPLFDFQETRFYEATMGPGVKKKFLAFEQLIDPARLPDWKLTTNDWEQEYQRTFSGPESRALNLDPGYLTEAKLVLATTKDRDHRLYVAQGIFAEVTLIYQGQEWQPQRWTYPDYRRGDYHQFFTSCRNYLRRRYGKNSSTREE